MVAFRPVCCDTSFLVSLYKEEPRSSEAKATLANEQRRLQISELIFYEFSNAIRFAACRRFIQKELALTIIRDLEVDLARKRLAIAPLSLPATLAEAKRLSATHTLTGGHRSMDILHVATALQLKASLFLTFDENQRTLARAEGLQVPE
jgi:predicted nucleic acid-binding protein